MSRAGRLVAVTLVVAAAAAGAWWWRDRAASAAGVPAAGEIGLQWRGRFRGRVVLPASLNWCPGTRTGLLQGLSGDTGILVALHEREALVRGVHQVTSPEAAAGVARPAATAAIRWLRDSQTIVGFASTGGTVNVGDVGTTATGSLELRMRVPGGTDTLVVRGTFDRVPVTATAVGCS